MVTRLLLGALLLAASASCSVSGESCGLGRCQLPSTCTTLFTDTFTSKAAGPGTDIDHNYWCVGPCPSGKKGCTGQCLEDPNDDSNIVCAGTTMTMKISCPSTLGATINGSCQSFTVTSCELGGTSCPANQECPTGTLHSGEAIGPIAIGITSGSPLDIDLSSLSHTTDADPPLSQTLPQGIVPVVNIPATCSN